MVINDGETAVGPTSLQTIICVHLYGLLTNPAAKVMAIGAVAVGSVR